MFKLDHIMIETSNPENDAAVFVDDFQLPYAWPLTNTNDYSSVGVNIGDFNIEFIKFNVRFGIPKNNYKGLYSGPHCQYSSLKK